MDPLTHTLAGAALARAGLDRRTPLALPTLVLAANAPDIDILSALGGEYASLAFRRGWTHGPLAMLAMPVVIVGCMRLWDAVRRRHDSTAAPVRWQALFALALIGVISHPLLDWLNTYGIRLLMPFSSRWFYGDAVFIIDPWIWLSLGGGLYLTGPHSWRRTSSFLVLALLCSLVVLLAPPVPREARIAWMIALILIIGERLRVARTGERTIVRSSALVALVYVFCSIGASVVGERTARATARDAGIANVVETLYAPLPANPFAAQIVIATDYEYHFGELRWLSGGRIELHDLTVPRGDWSQPAVRRALDVAAARDYLVWSRFPYVQIETSDDGTAVTIGDARYAQGLRPSGLQGVRVVVPE